MKDPFKEYPQRYSVKIPYPQNILDWLEAENEVNTDIINIFEKERDSRVELTKLDKEEFRRRFKPFRQMLRKRFFIQGSILDNNEYYKFRYIRPILENPMNKKIAHICSITDILDD